MFEHNGTISLHSAHFILNRSSKNNQETALQHSKSAISEYTTERQTQNGIEYSDKNDELEQAQT